MNKEEIKKLLQKLGLDTVGIAPIGPYEELRKILQDKADKNLITGMEEADIEKRINPKLIMEDAKSIIVCAFPYYISEQYQSNISRYCYGQDYHLVIKNKLNNICEEIKSKDNKWFKFDFVPNDISIVNYKSDYTGRVCVIGRNLNKDSIDKLFS